jgi:hypothetical protein
MLEVKTFYRAPALAFAILSLLTPSQAATGNYSAREVVAKVSSLREKISEEKEFLAKVAKRAQIAKSLHAQGVKMMKTAPREAQAYFEASRMISRVAVELTQIEDTGTKVDDVVEFWTAVTAHAAVERFEKGVQKMRAYEEFMKLYADGYYRKQIARIEKRIPQYKLEEVSPLEKKLGYFSDFLKIAGRWRPEEGDSQFGWVRYDFTKDGDVRMTGYSAWGRNSVDSRFTWRVQDGWVSFKEGKYANPTYVEVESSKKIVIGGVPYVRD